MKRVAVDTFAIAPKSVVGTTVAGIYIAYAFSVAGAVTSSIPLAFPVAVVVGGISLISFLYHFTKHSVKDTKRIDANKAESIKKKAIYDTAKNGFSLGNNSITTINKGDIKSYIQRLDKSRLNELKNNTDKLLVLYEDWSRVEAIISAYYKQSYVPVDSDSYDKLKIISEEIVVFAANLELVGLLNKHNIIKIDEKVGDNMYKRWEKNINRKDKTNMRGGDLNKKIKDLSFPSDAEVNKIVIICWFGELKAQISQIIAFKFGLGKGSYYYKHELSHFESTPAGLGTNEKIANFFMFARTLNSITIRIDDFPRESTSIYTPFITAMNNSILQGLDAFIIWTPKPRRTICADFRGIGLREGSEYKDRVFFVGSKAVSVLSKLEIEEELKASKRLERIRKSEVEVDLGLVLEDELKMGSGSKPKPKSEVELGLGLDDEYEDEGDYEDEDEDTSTRQVKKEPTGVGQFKGEKYDDDDYEDEDTSTRQVKKEPTGRSQFKKEPTGKSRVKIEPTNRIQVKKEPNNRRQFKKEKNIPVVNLTDDGEGDSFIKNEFFSEDFINIDDGDDDDDDEDGGKDRIDAYKKRFGKSEKHRPKTTPDEDFLIMSRLL